MSEVPVIVFSAREPEPVDADVGRTAVQETVHRYLGQSAHVEGFGGTVRQVLRVTHLKGESAKVVFDDLRQRQFGKLCHGVVGD